MQERPERLSCPTPRYPEVLREAQIEGRVVLSFVINQNGRADQKRDGKADRGLAAQPLSGRAASSVIAPRTVSISCSVQ